MTSRASHIVVRWSALATLLIGAILPAPGPVYADSAPVVHQVRQQDIDNDGQPDLAIIEASFATEHDLIYVADQGDDMAWSANWRSATDFLNDIWLYDIGGDSTIQLIVVFTNENGRAAGYLYDDRDGDGQVSHERNGTTVEILESPYWTSRIVSESDWLLSDGRINLAVNIELDGPHRPMLDRMPQDYVDEWLQHDGSVDISFEQATDADGIATYAITRLEADSPPGEGFQRTRINSNDRRTPVSPHDVAFFPFLAIPPDRQEPTYARLRYFDLPPNIHVDWEHGKVDSVVLDGYPIGHGWHANDDQYAIRGQMNDVSFESPQAYYDLANENDAFPELHIRLFTRPPRDPNMYFLPGMTTIPWQVVRYDWRLLPDPGRLVWDFKVGVAGNHMIDSLVRLGDTSFRMVPFNELPWWVTERDWKLTTFVAREGDGYDSSEGIYEWEPDAGADPIRAPDRFVFEARDAAFGYMLGTREEKPDAYFQTTYPGFRAERRFSGPDRPYLYFSPVDKKFHLRGAEAGIWTIDDSRSIRYSDLDGDGYLDRWQYLEDGEVRRELIRLARHLLYTDDHQISLKAVDVAHSILETVPPRNEEEWREQSQFLQANLPSFAPEDFTAMFDQVPGRTWRVRGGTMRDVRPDGSGYRFVLSLEQGFRVRGRSGPNLGGLTAGSYLVTYGESFSVEQSVPAALSATLAPIALTSLQINEVPINLRNDGLEDVIEATVDLWATSPTGVGSSVATQDVQLLGRRSMTSKLLWAPPSPGRWVLTPRIRQPDGQLVEGQALTVNVLTPPVAADPLMVSSSLERVPLLVGGLATIAGIAALIVRVSVARGTRA